MSNLWEDMTKTLREGVDTLVEKTDELTKIGRIKVDLLNLKRRIEKNFTELGGRVYHLIAEEKDNKIASHPEVKAIIDRIKRLEGELNAREQELEHVKEGSRQSASGPKKPPAGSEPAGG